MTPAKNRPTQRVTVSQRLPGTFHSLKMSCTASPREHWLCNSFLSE